MLIRQAVTVISKKLQKASKEETRKEKPYS